MASLTLVLDALMGTLVPLTCRGADLVFKDVQCPCGKGQVKRDLTYA